VAGESSAAGGGGWLMALAAKCQCGNQYQCGVMANQWLAGGLESWPGGYNLGEEAQK